VNIGGIAVKIVDTAGIRSTEDVVERLGVQKTLELVRKADLVLIVVDAELGLEQEDYEVIELVKEAGKKYLLLVNKIDLVEEITLDAENNLLKISAKYEQGIEQLEQAIKDLADSGQITASAEALITRERHFEALRRARLHLEETRAALENGLSFDFLTIDLKAALEALGEIIGEAAGEDIIEQIFKDFCIGK